MLLFIINFFLKNRLWAFVLFAALGVWGLTLAPFNWAWSGLPQNPIAVDAIPDLGEQQQIVYTSWPGHSAQDVNDQINYPLSSALLGLPGIKTVRSHAMYGTSMLYLIFEQETDFYWSRSRVLEKLNALPKDLLPQGVTPALGPDATAMGQVYWYTLEGLDTAGQPTGGWDLQALRQVQDFYVKQALAAVPGVAEVASVGGFVQEYIVEVKPQALRTYGFSLAQVGRAVQNSNAQVGASTIELNQAAYLVRGLGYVESVAQLNQAVVGTHQGVPVTLEQVAHVGLGPAERLGVLDKAGAEAVGGVVVARYGANPMATLKALKAKIKALAPALPGKTLANGTYSQLSIVPFYDRSQVIQETIGTLEHALGLQILITLLVVLFMMWRLRAALLVAAMVPLAVLLVFVAMQQAGLTANIVALSGIAIAIGTMVDLAVILVQNILQQPAGTQGSTWWQQVQKAVQETAPAIVTAVSTTIISFVPVFLLEEAEGKLFGPLAFTKTAALVAALVLVLLLVPALAYVGLHPALGKRLGAWLPERTTGGQAPNKKPQRPINARLRQLPIVVAIGVVLVLLSRYWLPLGPAYTGWANALFTLLLVGGILGGFALLRRYYPALLHWCLAHKGAFLSLPAALLVLGFSIWLGFGAVFGWLAQGLGQVGLPVQNNALWRGLEGAFPGLESQFMPALDEGSFLLMPSSPAHASISANKQLLQQLDVAVSAIPEVQLVVGKLGRAATALDPAPISMFENIIQYKPEYATDQRGRRQRFKVNAQGQYLTQSGQVLSHEQALAQGVDARQLVPYTGGQLFRQWRPHIKSPDHIWQEVARAAQLPGLTGAPKLQPIETRLVMLQTGMRAPIGIKVYGPNIESIEAFGQQLAPLLKRVPGVLAGAVYAERNIGQPYLDVQLNRPALKAYGLQVAQVQQHIATAIGGQVFTQVLQERERIPIRVRYPREWRNRPEALAQLLVPTPGGGQVPLGQIASIVYNTGPQSLKTEDTFLTGYVLLDAQEGTPATQVVQNAQAAIEQAIAQGTITLPAGVRYAFSGQYQQQVRAQKRLVLIIPLVLLAIWLVLYSQFKRVAMVFIVFTGVALAFSGGFIMLWLYQQPWLAQLNIGGIAVGQVLGIAPTPLSVAVWVGFIALFGIATDDGVLMGTRLQQQLKNGPLPNNRHQLQQLVVQAASQRVRPAIITTATTLIALLPVLSATGRGASLMVPMAIPAVGGMLVAVLGYFLVPVLFYWQQLGAIKKHTQS